MVDTAELYDGPERRTTGRFETALDITLRETGHNAMQAKVTSLSHLGCTVTGVTLFPTQGSVWIRLPGLESQLARQCWNRPGAAGFEFHRPLYPAVANRFGGERPVVQRPSLALVPSDGADERPASRRDQILNGHAAVPASLTATRRKSESGKATLGTLVRRNAARVVDYRHEPRFPPPPEAKLGFRAGGVHADIQDISPSGLKVDAELPGGIGAAVEIAFAGFDSMQGTLVWVRQGTSGVRLPDNALELSPEA